MSMILMVFPFAPTLEGQYIIKNLVLIGAGLVIGSTVRGGQIVPEPLDRWVGQPSRQIS